MNVYSVRIAARSPAALRALDRFALDLKHRAAKALAPDRLVVPGVLADDEIAAVRAAGYDVEVVADLSRVAAERSLEVSAGNRFAEEGVALEDAARRVLGYLNNDEVDTALQSLATLHPDLVTLVTLPNTTWEGRTCYAVRIRATGPGTAPEDRRAGVLITGSVHAREWGGADICVTFAVGLVEAYRAGTGVTLGGQTFSAGQVRVILERDEVFVFPNVNPDGKAYSQAHDPGRPMSTWWRKNRRPLGSGQTGVDLNRNFDFLWDSGIGTSTQLASPVYRGTAPFSEPEVRNIRHLFDAFPSIRYYVDVHSFGGLILYNWGDDENQTATPTQNFRNAAFAGQRGVVGDTVYREWMSWLDQTTAVNLAGRMHDALRNVRGRDYTVQQAVGLYPTSGTSDDYAFSRHLTDALKGRVYAYTLEFGEEFVPPYTEMDRIIRDVRAALMELCVAVASDACVRDNASDAGDVPSAGAFWDSPDVWVRNADDGGTAHQNTVRGQDNWIRVRVRNRGAADARDVRVRVLMAHFAGTEFVHPFDWVPRNPAGGGALTGTGTYLLGEAALPTLAAGETRVVGMRWDRGLIPPDASWHPCLLVEVAPADGPPPPTGYVWSSNNLAQKNLTIVDARRGQRVVFPFRVGNPFGAATRAREIAVRRVAAPARLALHLLAPDQDLLTPLRPRPGSGLRPAGTTVTLTTPALVGVGPGGPRAGDEGWVLRLPAGTRFEPLGARDEDHDDAPAPSVLDKDEAVSHAVRALPFAFKVAATERFRLRVGAREARDLALAVAVPAGATIGAVYEVHVTQSDIDGQTVGGVALRVRVVR